MTDAIAKLAETLKACDVMLAMDATSTIESAAKVANAINKARKATALLAIELLAKKGDF